MGDESNSDEWERSSFNIAHLLVPSSEFWQVLNRALDELSNWTPAVTSNNDVNIQKETCYLFTINGASASRKSRGRDEYIQSNKSM